MRLGIFTAIVLATMSFGTASTAGLVQAVCQPPVGAASIPRAQAPVAIQRVLKGIAEPGAPFNGGDVMDGRASARLMLIWATRQRWLVLTEYGGFGYHQTAVLYNVSSDGKTATPISQMYFSSCDALERLLGPDPLALPRN